MADALVNKVKMNNAELKVKQQQQKKKSKKPVNLAHLILRTR